MLFENAAGHKEFLVCRENHDRHDERSVVGDKVTGIDGTLGVIVRVQQKNDREQQKERP